MSYTYNFPFTFRKLPGLTLNAAIYDAANPTPNQIGPTITSGFSEIGHGVYSFWATIPDGHVGSFVVWDADNLDRVIVMEINPQTTENNDAKTSSIVGSLMSYAMMGARQFQDVIMDLWAVVVGNASANDATNPTVIDYQNVVTGGQVTHILDGTTRTRD